MINLLVKDIAEYLQSNGVGQLAKDIFLMNRPDQPDNIVVLFPTGGFQQKLPIEDVQMTAQILVRDKSPQTGYGRIWRIYKLLDGGKNRHVVAPSGRQMIINAMQQPIFLDRDANERSLFVFNISILTNRD